MSAAALVYVHGVEDKSTLKRFSDLPFRLHHEDPRWVRPVRAFDEWRLDARRHPYFDRGDAAYFVARRAGAVAGRIVAHLADGAAPADGRFGFFDTVDDDRVVDALLSAACQWLVDQGASSMTGPFSWTAAEEAGVQSAGFDQPGRTAVPWHPPWYLDQLARRGGVVVDTIRRAEVDVAHGEVPPATGAPTPTVAGTYADPRLVLDGIAGVPDVAAALATTGVRAAWKLAKQARERRWERAVATRVDATDVEAAVYRFRLAAGAAGYETVNVPIDAGSARTEHALVRFAL